MFPFKEYNKIIRPYRKAKREVNKLSGFFNVQRKVSPLKKEYNKMVRPYRKTKREINKLSRFFKL